MIAVELGARSALPFPSGAQRMRASRTARMSSASVEAQRDQRRRGPHRAAPLARALAQPSQRAQRIHAQRLDAQQREVLGDRLGKPIRRLQHARQLGARRDVAARDPRPRCAARRRRARTTSAARCRATPAACARSRASGATSRKRPSAAARRDGSSSAVRIVSRRSIARSLLRVARARRRSKASAAPSGSSAGPASNSPRVTRCPTRASRSRLDGGQPPQRRRRVRPVALAREAARQPRQRGQIVGRRQQRVPVRVDGLADVGQRALGDVADAGPRRAHTLRIRRRGDRQPIGRDRVGGPPDLGLHLGQADQRRHRRRIQRHRLAQHRQPLRSDRARRSDPRAPAIDRAASASARRRRAGA